MAKNMSPYAGQDEIKAFQGPEYERAGDYLERIDEVEEWQHPVSKTFRVSIKKTIVRLLEAQAGYLPSEVGAQVSQMFDFSKPAARAAHKLAMLKLWGQKDKDYAGLRKLLTEAGVTTKGMEDAALIEELSSLTAGTEQPLAGLFVRTNKRTKLNKSGNDFTYVDYQRVVDADELTAEERARFGAK